MPMQHLCGQIVAVAAWHVHGETILDVTDPHTGEPLAVCPDCGEPFFENTLFSLELFQVITEEVPA